MIVGKESTFEQILAAVIDYMLLERWESKTRRKGDFSFFQHRGQKKNRKYRLKDKYRKGSVSGARAKH